VDKFNYTIEGLQRVADDTKATFGAFSPRQLNWKPGSKSWSVAQCFDHLIRIHSLYLPLFERLASGDPKMSVWEKISPLSGFFGRFLIKSLDPANLKKMKTTAKAFPSESEIGGDIIARFGAHQSELTDRIQKLPADLDPTRTIVTSPLFGIVTYTLADTLTILDVHCRRHYDQALRVTKTEGFPG